MTKSWKPEVIADSSGTWASNMLRFATKEEAEIRRRPDWLWMMFHLRLLSARQFITLTRRRLRRSETSLAPGALHGSADRLNGRSACSPRLRRRPSVLNAAGGQSATG